MALTERHWLRSMRHSSETSTEFRFEVQRMETPYLNDHFHDVENNEGMFFSAAALSVETPSTTSRNLNYNARFFQSRVLNEWCSLTCCKCYCTDEDVTADREPGYDESRDQSRKLGSCLIIVNTWTTLYVYEFELCCVTWTAQAFIWRRCCCCTRLRLRITSWWLWAARLNVPNSFAIRIILDFQSANVLFKNIKRNITCTSQVLKYCA